MTERRRAADGQSSPAAPPTNLTKADDRGNRFGDPPTVTILPNLSLSARLAVQPDIAVSFRAKQLVVDQPRAADVAGDQGDRGGGNLRNRFERRRVNDHRVVDPVE